MSSAQANPASTEAQPFEFKGWSQDALKFLLKMNENSRFTRLPRFVNSKKFLSNEVQIPETMEEIKKFEIQWFFSAQDQKVEGITYFGSDVEGPPNCVHGGASAAVMDALMGTLAWECGMKAVTLNLNVNYRKFIPLSTPVRVEAHVDKIEGKKIYISTSLRSLDGSTTHVEGSGLWYDISDRI
eukprot:CAMPEP_0117450006 /NCGR_PEP_ID=MMETSP0759-20121206/8242_1 /TAXON_ID=63605 /ORGANISM="Percolomonas cosmopolitus, Strain WS" /LENGTH=183 /DNA_ID=CAMNT_0005242507 /DNA_START=77 /DNA_END=628 /DNA_ORIENTATION=+